MVHGRQEYAHQTSHALVIDAAYDLYAFEGLQIKNMTKRPKAKKDAPGHFLLNGAKAKAGLNRAILSWAWGQVVPFTCYKAWRQAKLVIMVPFATSAQECAVCTFISPDNRLIQTEFVCQCCGPLIMRTTMQPWGSPCPGSKSFFSAMRSRNRTKLRGYFHANTARSVRN